MMRHNSVSTRLHCLAFRLGEGSVAFKVRHMSGEEFNQILLKAVPVENGGHLEAAGQFNRHVPNIQYFAWALTGHEAR